MRYFFISVLLASFFFASGQSIHPKAVSVSFTNQSFGFPSQHIFKGKLHPGITGTAYFNREKASKSNQEWSVDLGYFQHDHFQSGLFLVGGLNYNILPDRKVSFTWGPRAGYLLIYYPDGAYSFEDGAYQRKSGARSNVLLGVNGTFSAPIHKEIPLSLFAGINLTIDGPFAINFGIPAIPRVFSQIGITYQL